MSDIDDDLERVGTIDVPDGGLPRNARQEQFSLAFVRLVVAAAGCSVKNHETDYDGVDITIASSAEYGTFYCPDFELQVKCTTRHDLLTEDHLAWPMKARPFTKLINPKRYNEAFLGVLLIPPDSEPWLDVTENGLATSSRMYWEHAAKLGGASARIRVPRPCSCREATCSTWTDWRKSCGRSAKEASGEHLVIGWLPSHRDSSDSPRRVPVPRVPRLGTRIGVPERSGDLAARR